MSNSFRRVSRPPRPVVLLAAAAMMVPPPLGACGSGENDTEEIGYACTAADGTVVDEDYCDEDSDGRGGVYFFHSYPYGAYGGSAPSRGTRLSGGTTIRYNDATARSNAGLPSTGKVSSATKVTVKSGGIGSGKAGTSGGGGRAGSGGS